MYTWKEAWKAMEQQQQQSLGRALIRRPMMTFPSWSRLQARPAKTSNSSSSSKSRTHRRVSLLRLAVKYWCVCVCVNLSVYLINYIPTWWVFFFCSTHLFFLYSFLGCDKFTILDIPLYCRMDRSRTSSSNDGWLFTVCISSPRNGTDSYIRWRLLKKRKTEE